MKLNKTTKKHFKRIPKEYTHICVAYMMALQNMGLNFWNFKILIIFTTWFWLDSVLTRTWHERDSKLQAIVNHSLDKGLTNTKMLMVYFILAFFNPKDAKISFVVFT